MMLTTAVATREQLVERASELVPQLRKTAAWSEENRRTHEESMEALAAAGIFKMRAPRHYGGYECDTQTLVDVAATLALGDGSVSWVTSVYWIPTWMACLFPDEVQDEVFSTPDVRVCGTLSPTAMAAPAAGGVVVNGKWGFITGALHSHWQEIIAILVGPEGEPAPIMALVPMSDLHIVDDWYTAGMKGTGSVSTVAQDLFIPQERVLPLGAVLQGQHASKRNADSPIYRAPLLPVACASSVGTMVGLARAARETFLDRLPDRKISYTNYASQKEAPLTHLQVAEATMRVDETEFHAYRLAQQVDVKGVQASPWTVAERVRARADLGAAGRLAKEAVEILATASGGSSVYSDVPIQRIQRDIQTVNQHALMHPNTNAELYGRILCGLEPNTQYL
jgi:alkylation response protein AidB-like acyl-CoA dehydrogenase